jgi:hypothetical protein
MRWRAVAEPPRCRRVRMGAHWPGHMTMGCRGPLASRPCHLNFSLNLKISTKFVFQIGGFPIVQNSQNFVGQQLKI